MEGETDPRVAMREETPERVLGRVSSGRGGPLLIVVGALHGNEPAGVLALRRLFALLADGVALERGTLVGLIGNV